MIDWTLFNEADWAILAVLGLSVVLSLWRGFVKEAASLAGWIAAFVIANVFTAVFVSRAIFQWEISRNPKMQELSI